MIFKDQKEEALGGNYKIKDIKIFGSKENLYQNVKKYRKVFDYSECRYLYCELSFYNKLFDEVDWEANVRFVCTRRDSGEQICELKKKLQISKVKNIIYVREGWGTPEVGWWQEGTYRWEVFIDQKSVGTALFYVVAAGLVIPEANPYFDIEAIRLFESTREGLPLDQRLYLKTFASTSTRYINIEMRLQSHVHELDLFPLELQFNFYNDSGQQKAYMAYFQEIRDHRKEILLDTGYGSDTSGYWYPDKYTLEVVFMDQLIAVIPFEIGDFEVEETQPLDFAQNKSANKELTDQSQKLSFAEAKEDLENLIGLQSVKEQINELASYLQFLKVRKEKGLEGQQKLNLHSVFTGNPGTGKTTVANMLGKIYFSLDLLSHGRVYEVDRADLVGEFIGQTAPKVKKAIDKARGGILFIDEAYALTNRNDDGKDFGREVIEILLKELSDGSDDLAIIFAGYPKEMSHFLNSNPGLSSRLRNVIHFPDYSPDELMSIIQYTANRRGVLISPAAAEIIHQRLVEIYRNRNDQFGNARFVNGIVEEAKQNMAIRLIATHQNLEQLEAELLSIIEAEDVEKVFRSGVEDGGIHLPIDEALLQDALSQLHELVGLNNIKREVDEMSKLVRYYREIGKDIRKAFSLHAVFKGNPGTGKTTVARLLVQIYKALGILERGHLVECDRKSLVAGYVGQTAIKTSELIDKALGGGLFIDEAYALNQGGANDFGREAIETLLKRMEDHRGEFMVIVAGYPQEMMQFIEANPGLMSRFDKQFNFNDYTEQELLSIAQLMFKAEALQLDEAAQQHLEAYIHKLLSNKHRYFGNARTIRKIVSETIRRQHLRMAEIPAAQRTSTLIQQITLEDISSFQLMEELPEEKKGIG
ncbi:MAG: AAA family ATPase, partial [Bacteroidota bacterium]